MIEVENLTFSYQRGAPPAVAGLTFRIAPGEIFGFLGPSGAGKSTTQKILTGLLRGYAGQAVVLGREVAAWGHDYYERIGVAFELPNHFRKLTAEENLRYFGALYQRRAYEPRKLLALVGLEADAKTPVAQFSKGMLNRLTFARALIHNPDVLFLDEPTSGLDPANSRRIRDLIRAQQQAGKTIFLTTHTMALASELCGQVAFLVNGRIVLADSPRALELRYGAPSVCVEYANGAGLSRRQFPLAGLGDNPEFLALLRSGTVGAIHSQESTLEDVFIKVTGRTLQ